MGLLLFLEVDPEDASRVRERFPDAKVVEKSLEGEALIDAARDAEIVSTFIYTKFPGNVLQKLPKLKLLCTRSVGFNHIDLEACGEQGIIVTNVPDYGSHVIAEHVFAMLLSTLRHIPEADRRVEGGTFDYRGLRGMALRGKTMGIVGTGKIGERVAEIAFGFGMRILAFDKCRREHLERFCGVRYVSFETLLRESDFVTLHLPALRDTEHMLNAASFAQLKNGAILVNTARGELIDSQALVHALKAGKIRYAMLDVLEHEKNFEENRELISLPNVITTPHIAFYADDSMRNMYEDCFDSIRQFLKGEIPLHRVLPAKVVCDLPGYPKDGVR
jgi:D-lactate dehydrogenase